MGKKRTNKAKKKQAVRTKRLSSTCGVSVVKGGALMRKHSDSAVNGNWFADDISVTLPNPVVRSIDHQSENCEFRRMHASLEERSLALQARKDGQRQIKMKRQLHKKKGRENFARPTHFYPATLHLASQTTQESVDDAADQMAQGMNEIGQRAKNNLSGGLSSSPGQSSLEAVANRNWKVRLSSVQNQLPHQTNPFAALEDDSDGDDELVTNKVNTVQKFQFKPASFSFQPSFPRARPVADDTDPDL